MGRSAFLQARSSTVSAGSHSIPSSLTRLHSFRISRTVGFIRSVRHLRTMPGMPYSCQPLGVKIIFTACSCRGSRGRRSGSRLNMTATQTPTFQSTKSTSHGRRFRRTCSDKSTSLIRSITPRIRSGVHISVNAYIRSAQRPLWRMEWISRSRWTGR